MIEKLYKAWHSPAVRWLYSVPLTVVCLALLMILTFWGTLYQVEQGLFAAQEKFFSSWFILLFGFLPFPGATLVLGVLMLNLTGYMIHMLAFQPLKPGIVMIHAGLLLLLIGGAITRQYGEESYLSLWEGEASNVSSAYHDWELAVWSRDGYVRDIRAVETDGLTPGDTLTFEPLPIRVEVEQYYPHARAFQTRDGNSAFLNAMNISRIEEAPLNKEPTQNIPAGIFTVTAPGMDPAKILLFGEDTAPLVIPVGDEEYSIGLQSRKSPLPILVKLLDFRKEMHPGTEIARTFSSRVEIQTDDIKRELTISMNKPLRFGGFTFFQQSYRESPDGKQSSTFAVTRNYGRLLPYYGTGIIVLGMIVHFAAMLIKQARRRRKAAA